MIVVVRRRARPGREEEALEALRARFEQRAALASARRRAAVLQGMEDPAELLDVAVWDTRPAFEAALDETDRPAFSDLFEGPSTSFHCNELASYETVYRAPALVACLVIEGARAGEAADEALRHFERARLGAAPGLVQYDIGLSADDLTRLVILHGWDSPESLRDFRAASLSDFRARLDALGLAVTPFQSRVRAQFTR